MQVPSPIPSHDLSLGESPVRGQRDGQPYAQETLISSIYNIREQKVFSSFVNDCHDSAQIKVSNKSKSEKCRNQGLQLWTGFYPSKTQAVTSLVLANSNKNRHLYSSPYSVTCSYFGIANAHVWSGSHIYLLYDSSGKLV